MITPFTLPPSTLHPPTGSTQVHTPQLSSTPKTPYWRTPPSLFSPTRRHYADAARQGRIQARSRLPLVPLDAVSDPGLKKAFKAYCRVPIGVGRQVGASVQHLNAAQFNLLARDVGLVEPAGERGGGGG
jgi:hypothetical protein